MQPVRKHGSVTSLYYICYIIGITEKISIVCYNMKVEISIIYTCDLNQSQIKIL